MRRKNKCNNWVFSSHVHGFAATISNCRTLRSMGHVSVAKAKIDFYLPTTLELRGVMHFPVHSKCCTSITISFWLRIVHVSGVYCRQRHYQEQRTKPLDQIIWNTQWILESQFDVVLIDGWTSECCAAKLLQYGSRLSDLKQQCIR